MTPELRSTPQLDETRGWGGGSKLTVGRPALGCRRSGRGEWQARRMFALATESPTFANLPRTSYQPDATSEGGPRLGGDYFADSARPHADRRASSYPVPWYGTKLRQRHQLNEPWSGGHPRWTSTTLPPVARGW